MPEVVKFREGTRVGRLNLHPCTVYIHARAYICIRINIICIIVAYTLIPYGRMMLSHIIGSHTFYFTLNIKSFLPDTCNYDK